MELDPIEIQWLNQFLQHRQTALHPEPRTGEAESVNWLESRARERAGQWINRLIQEQVAPALIQYMARNPRYSFCRLQLNPGLSHLN